MENNFTVDLSNATTLRGRNTKISIFRKLYLWWKFEGKYSHIKFLKGIKNLFRWFPVIWKDRDYDDHYIWEILKTKIKFQAKYIGERDFHTNAKRDAEIMLLCANLIDKIQTEYYPSEYMDYHESEIYFIPLSNEEVNNLDDEMKDEMVGGSTMHFRDICDNFDEFFAKYPHAYREVTKTPMYIFPNDTKQKIAMNIGYYLHSKAKRIFFELLQRNIEKWWD